MRNQKFRVNGASLLLERVVKINNLEIMNNLEIIIKKKSRSNWLFGHCEQSARKDE